MAAPSYRDFLYPLNVFMHILTQEEGEVEALHYGLFETAAESINAAQKRSTELLLSRLPPPPATLLDVGAGLGTTLARLTSLGYRATGLTPDAHQIEAIHQRQDALDVHCLRFEEWEAASRFDAVFFQESSQYIDSEALFAKAAAVTGHVIVIDEFATEPLSFPGALHTRDGFVEAAARNGFGVTEELDLTSRATPTMEYFAIRIPRHRERLIADLGVGPEQIDDLIESGARYRDLYEQGLYVYRLIQLHRR